MSLNSLSSKLTKNAVTQCVQYASAITEQHYKVDVVNAVTDFSAALEAENNGVITQFSPKVVKIKGVANYHPALPTTSTFIQPTTATSSISERIATSEDFNLNRKQIELSNVNVVNDHLYNLSQQLYGNKTKLINSLQEVKHLDIYSIENALKTQELISDAISKVDKIINIIHNQGELAAFISGGRNALYIAIILNFMSVERFIYAINWLYINSENNVHKLYSRLFSEYDLLRQEAENAELDANGNLLLSKESRFNLVSIAHFFERIRYIQKRNAFEAIHSIEAQESLTNIMKQIQSNQS